MLPSERAGEHFLRCSSLTHSALAFPVSYYFSHRVRNVGKKNKKNVWKWVREHHRIGLEGNLDELERASQTQWSSKERKRERKCRRVLRNSFSCGWERGRVREETEEARKLQTVSAVSVFVSNKRFSKLASSGFSLSLTYSLSHITLKESIIPAEREITVRCRRGRSKYFCFSVALNDAFLFLLEKLFVIVFYHFTLLTSYFPHRQCCFHTWKFPSGFFGVVQFRSVVKNKTIIISILCVCL